MPVSPVAGRICWLSIFALLFAVTLAAADVPRNYTLPVTTNDQRQPQYRWRSVPVENSAELVTLFLHTGDGAGRDVPVVSVLRDNLGDNDPQNDRLTSVWLLTYEPLTPVKRVLAAVPFMYWSLGSGSARVPKQLRPLADLTQPENGMFYSISRNLLQWTTLDPMAMPVRASSRAYEANFGDQQRLHLEEAIGYLRRAPAAGAGQGLTQAETDSVIARLELQKTMLGGLVGNRALARIGAEHRYDEQRVQSRNWELLRQLAERTGLYFEPLELTGTSEEYAALWFSPQGSEPAGVAHKPLWKILNIRDPWTDARLRQWKGVTSVRALDANGSLLPPGQTGAKEITLIPLAVYSMDYDRMPLLMVDFRDTMHIRRHEMTQRAINEVTSGVIGISHFTNWYYYVAADAYDFVSSRHGGAVDKSQRLDSYARFRVALALDSSVDPQLRHEMQERAQAMSVNPLESSPEKEVEIANTRYRVLQSETQDGQLTRLLDKQRRSELAQFGKTPKQLAKTASLHWLTFGAYTARVPENQLTLARLDETRRVNASLAFLEAVEKQGTPPEVAYDSKRLQDALRGLSAAPQQLVTPAFQQRAQAVVQKFQSLTNDPAIAEECRLVLRRVSANSPTIAARVRALPVPVMAESAK